MTGHYFYEVHIIKCSSPSSSPDSGSSSGTTNTTRGPEISIGLSTISAFNQLNVSSIQ